MRDRRFARCLSFSATHGDGGFPTPSRSSGLTPTPTGQVAVADLASAMRAFYDALFQLGGALLPHSDRIGSVALRQQVTHAIARTVAATHRHIHEVVSRPGSGYDSVGTILLHSPDEVDTLLS